MAASKYKRNTVWLMLMLFAMLAGVSGCKTTSQNSAVKQQAGQEDEPAAEENPSQQTALPLYIVLNINLDKSVIFVQEVETKLQDEFTYYGGTYIYDQYGESVTVSNLQVGELVELTADDDKLLSQVNVSRETFIQDGITDFTVDNLKNIFRVDKSNYNYDESLKVFSEGNIVSLTELSDKDTISIRGKNKKILTVVITKGHGSLYLENTELFEGGLIIIGNVEATEIRKNMTLEIPEGTYTLTVSNEGFGDSKEITMSRFEDLTVDLEELKGEGPQSGNLKFAITPQDAKVTIDGGDVDTSQRVELPYGVYRLLVAASGYKTWSGRLFVYNKDDLVTVNLEESASSGSNIKENEDNTTDTNNSNNQTQNQTQNGNNSGGLAGSSAGSMTDGSQNNNNANNSNGTSNNTIMDTTENEENSNEQLLEMFVDSITKGADD